MWNKKLNIILLCIPVLAVFLNGCGSSSKEGNGATTPGTVARVDEALCAQCHGSAVDAVTTQSIYAGYRNSSHFTKNAAGCQDCHGGGAEHNGVGPMPYPKPDVAGICNNCHNETTMASTSPAHFSAAPIDLTHPLGTDATATYVDSQTKCTNCHDPHDTTLSTHGTPSGFGVYAQWAGEGHGDTQAPPWIADDFGSPAFSGGVCARCHSASGYKLYLQNPQAGNWGWKTGASANDGNKEVLRCDGCHTSFAFQRRDGATNGANAALLAYSTTIPSNALVGNKLSNAGDSNLCVNCHTGRQSGTFISTRATFAQLSTSQFSGFNSHYKAAAGNLYAIIGYEGYQTSHTKYAAVGFLHNRIGLDSSFSIPAQTGVPASVNLGTSRGPCVTCHLTDVSTGAAANHTFAPFVGDMGLTGTVTTASVVCSACHIAGSSLQLGAAEINTLKAQYKAGLDAIATLLQSRYNITFNPDAYPYFTSTVTGNTIHWNNLAKTGGDAATGKGVPGQHLAGAAFNLNLLTREPGGYAHNQQYTMSLIYDTIDYLEDGVVTGTLNGTATVPLATLQFVFSVATDGVTPVTARPIGGLVTAPPVVTPPPVI